MISVTVTQLGRSVSSFYYAISGLVCYSGLLQRDLILGSFDRSLIPTLIKWPSKLRQLSRVRWSNVVGAVFMSINLIRDSDYTQDALSEPLRVEEPRIR